MSSSPRNARRLLEKKRRIASSELLLCPTCGRRTLRSVRADHRMGDGFVARDIERLACSSCGETLYSPAAMRKIELQREGFVPKAAGKA